MLDTCLSVASNSRSVCPGIWTSLVLDVHRGKTPSARHRDYSNSRLYLSVQLCTCVCIPAVYIEIRGSSLSKLFLSGASWKLSSIRVWFSSFHLSPQLSLLPLYLPWCNSSYYCCYCHGLLYCLLEYNMSSFSFKGFRCWHSSVGAHNAWVAMRWILIHWY